MGGQDLKDDVDRMIQSLGFPEKAYSAAGTLSGGQKRRLCVGISMVGGNSVVFLDEVPPLSLFLLPCQRYIISQPPDLTQCLAASYGSLFSATELEEVCAMLKATLLSNLRFS